MEKQNETYYTYVLLDPRKEGKFKYGRYTFTHEPFYVGKGKGRRYKTHEKYALAGSAYGNNFKSNKIRKINKDGYAVIVVFKKEDVGESVAFVTEEKLIKAIGRLDLKTGPLTNLTTGGEGQSPGPIAKKNKKKAMKKYYSEDYDETARAKKSEASTKSNLEYHSRLSKSEKETRGKNVSEALKKVGKKISKNTTLQHKNMTEEEKTERSKKMSSSRKVFLSTTTEEERSVISLKASKTRQGKPAKEREVTSKKISENSKAMHANMTPKKKREFKKNVSNAQKEYYASLTPEQREERKRKMMETRIKNGTAKVSDNGKRKK